jgi:hypothetical protein|tara:strand:- start:2 stop:379 length:378 start_codon:yes stop_codon:yes gene_type:complete
MKKLIFLVLAVLIVACSDDDSSCDVANASLVGEWNQTNLGADDLPFSVVFNSDFTGSTQEGEETPEPFTYVTTDTVLTILIAGEPGTEDLTADYPYEFETCDQVSIFEPGDDPGTEDIERILARQ